MLYYLLKKLIKKLNKGKSPVYVEDIVYKEQIYPLYIQTRDTFKFLMQNKILKRKNVLEFKKMINEYTYNNYTEYKNKKFKNDCHLIYTKLKSHYITKKQMKRLNNYLNQFI